MYFSEKELRNYGKVIYILPLHNGTKTYISILITQKCIQQSENQAKIKNYSKMVS